MGRYGLAFATVFLGFGLLLAAGCGGGGHSVDAPLPTYEKDAKGMPVMPGNIGGPEIPKSVGKPAKKS